MRRLKEEEAAITEDGRGGGQNRFVDCLSYLSNNNQPYRATANDGDSRVAIDESRSQVEDAAELKWRKLEDEMAALKLQGLEEETAKFKISVASAHRQTTINLAEVITE